jgi:hypothetical protein
MHVDDLQVWYKIVVSIIPTAYFRQKKKASISVFYPEYIDI